MRLNLDRPSCVRGTTEPVLLSEGITTLSLVSRTTVLESAVRARVWILCNLDSVHLSLLIPLRDHAGTEVVVRQGAFEGPALPVTAPVGPDLKVPALLDPLDGSMTAFKIAAVSCVESLQASLQVKIFLYV